MGKDRRVHCVIVVPSKSCKFGGSSAVGNRSLETEKEDATQTSAIASSKAMTKNSGLSTNSAPVEVDGKLMFLVQGATDLKISLGSKTIEITIYNELEWS